jgi:hypothetical protein
MRIGGVVKSEDPDVMLLHKVEFAAGTVEQGLGLTDALGERRSHLGEGIEFGRRGLEDSRCRTVARKELTKEHRPHPVVEQEGDATKEFVGT